MNCKWNIIPLYSLVLVDNTFISFSSLDQVASKNVFETVTRAMTSKVLLPVMCLVFPTLTVENVAHKPMIHQFLSQTPIVLPESVWNTKRDNLPWTIQLQDFSIFTSSSITGSTKNFILEPVHTSCTLGLNSRFHNDIGGEAVRPTLGICLHADTSSIKMSINDTQLCLAISIFENFLSFVSKFKPNMFFSDQSSSTNITEMNSAKDENSKSFIEAMNSDRNVKAIGSGGVREESPKGSEKIGDTISEKTRSVPVQSKLNRSESSKGQTEDSALSLWIQWTIPQIKIAAISEAIGQNGKIVKLELEMEDYLSSFDWTPVYFQMKMRILSANIHHFVKLQNKANNGKC